MGKTYHDDGGFISPPDYDWPFSWSPECGDKYFIAPLDRCDESFAGGGVCVPANRSREGTDFEDALVVDHAVSLLRNRSGNPFYFAVGIRRPHLPWALPEDVAAAAPAKNSLAVAAQQLKPEDTPLLAWYASLAEHPFRHVIPIAERSSYNPTHPFPVELQQGLRQGYYAAVMWADEQLGRLLAVLDNLGLSQSTVVLVHSDHGFSLGEKNAWSKESLSELNVRAPMLMRTPALMQERFSALFDCCECSLIVALLLIDGIRQYLFM